MAQLLTGRLVLSKIPADLIQRNERGEAFIWIDVAERQTPGQYGDTHNVSVYDKQTRQKIYLADLRPREFGGGSDNPARPSAYPAPAPAAPAPAPSPAPASDPNSLELQEGDLPW